MALIFFEQTVLHTSVVAELSTGAILIGQTFAVLKLSNDLCVLG